MALTKVTYSLVEGGYVSVVDYGADPTGVADSLAAIQAAGVAAVAANKTLYFPQGVYGITEVLLFEDGANVYCDPGATIKLLSATAGGGAVGICDAATATKRSQVINLTVDCNNILGENGFGFTHPVGAYIENITVKNCFIEWDKNTSSGRLGGKGLQTEGANCRNVMINGATIVNCSFGIDIGGESADNTIGIAIYNVKMENVSSPFLLKDTSFAQPRNNYDTIEVLIEGVSCRNCGDASDIGTTGVNPTDGGIIVCDRAYGVTIRNLQIVNDTGLSGTTAYPGIGGLVRGTVKSLILDDVLFVTTTSTAVFNFNFQAITPAATYDIASYVNAKNIRVYANLDHVVATKSGATIGAAEIKSVEIGSTGASLAGIVDANAGALSTAVLEVIDRDQTFVSTGTRTLKAIYDLGNQLTGPNGVVGKQVSASPTRSWTPVVTATSGTITTVGTVTGTYSVVGDLVFAFFDVTITTNGSGAGTINIAGLPIESIASASGSGVDTLSDKALQFERSGSNQFLLRFYDGTYAGADGAKFVGCYIYLAS
jgi:hypothetical protein